MIEFEWQEDLPDTYGVYWFKKEGKSDDQKFIIKWDGCYESFMDQLKALGYDYFDKVLVYSKPIELNPWVPCSQETPPRNRAVILRGGEYKGPKKRRPFCSFVVAMWSNKGLFGPGFYQYETEYPN